MAMRSKITKGLIIPVTIIFFCIFATGCKKEAVLDGESQMFKDYKSLEQALSMVGSHPNSIFETKLKEFKDEYGWDFALEEMPDGIYESYSVPDRYTYVHYLKFELENNTLKNVYYNEFLETDLYTTHFSAGGEEGKRADESYYENMKRYGNDVKLSETYPAMEKELLEKQNPEEVDGISGASLSLYRMKFLLMKALFEHKNNVIINKKKYDVGDAVDAKF